MWLKLHTEKCLELDRDDMDVTNITMAGRLSL